MELIFIRHFPTEGNYRRQYIGRTDEAVSVRFINDFQKTEQRKMPEAECVIISPMRRCAQTAKLLYPDVKPVVCEKMRECDFGLFEGKTYEELKDNAYYQKWLESGGESPFPEGESKTAFQKRCVKGMQEVMDFLIESRCKRAAMIVHGGTIMAVLSTFDKEKRDYYSFQVANGDGYKVTVDENEWLQGKYSFSHIGKLKG